MFQLNEVESIDKEPFVTRLADDATALAAKWVEFYDFWMEPDQDMTLMLIESGRIVKEMYPVLRDVSAVMEQIRAGRAVRLNDEVNLSPGSIWRSLKTEGDNDPEDFVILDTCLYTMFTSTETPELWSFRISKKGTRVCQPQSAQSYPYPIRGHRNLPIYEWTTEFVAQALLATETARLGSPITMSLRAMAPSVRHTLANFLFHV